MRCDQLIGLNERASRPSDQIGDDCWRVQAGPNGPSSFVRHADVQKTWLDRQGVAALANRVTALEALVAQLVSPKESAQPVRPRGVWEYEALLDDRLEFLRAGALKFEMGDYHYALEGNMSRLSESLWSAGWAHDCEYRFWAWIATGFPDEGEDDCEIHLALLRLATLAKHYRGWFVWDDPSARAKFVRFDEWQNLYEAWAAKQKREDR